MRVKISHWLRHQFFSLLFPLRVKYIEVSVTDIEDEKGIFYACNILFFGTSYQSTQFHRMPHGVEQVVRCSRTMTFSDILENRRHKHRTLSGLHKSLETGKYTWSKSLDVYCSLTEVLAHV